MNEGIPTISNTKIDPTDVSLQTWADLERGTFSSWNPSVAGYMQAAIFTCIQSQLIKKGSAKSKVSVQVPWGTFTSTANDKVVDLDWTPSKNFEKILNDENDLANVDCETLDVDMDKEFVNMINDIVSENMYKPEDADGTTFNGLVIQNASICYFLNSFTVMLATVAKEKEHDGKEYRLLIRGFGEYIFSYDDGYITPRFVPSKEFKQALKNDEYVTVEKAATEEDEVA